jgi:outer membrane PBP1 activator LpoA protein
MFGRRSLPRCNTAAPLGALVVPLLCLLLAGCPSLGPTTPPPPNLDRAELLESRGDGAAAARILEALAAENTGTDRAGLLLRAAHDYLTAHQPEEAARVLGLVVPPLTPAQSLEQQLLNAELALTRGEGPQAWQTLAAIPEPTDPSLGVRYWDLKRRAAFATGRPLDAVRAEMSSERWLASADQRRAARATLLTELRDASERGVRIDPRSAPDAPTRGWLELAPLAAQAARAPSAATAQIQSWEGRYPGHPADEVVRSELLGQRPVPVVALPHVALLLPLSGRQASAAVSVRDGFLTAYYVNASSQRPRVRIYDTASTSISEAIAHATQEGAEFIVGPLTREEVIAAAELATPHAPILALNFLPPDRTPPRAFYQFALSPEDEARQAARRVLADGHKRGIALIPEGEWGTRVLAAFKDELLQGGGTLIDTSSYDPAHPDYAAAVMQILRINDSNARFKRLESTLGTKLQAQFQPRRRADIAFIFVPSQQVAAARQLRPQLRFYFASDVPTYATSDAYEPDPNANQDMDGLMFPDMPWMLGGGLAESVRAAAREAWPSGGPRRNRLYAFGFDAYRLAAALRNAPADGQLSVEGLTGRLTLDAEHRVHRELDWAQLKDGQPRVLSRVEN